MGTIRARHVAGMVLLMGLVVGGALLTPLAIHSKADPPGLQVPAPNSRDAQASRFRAEQYLVDMGKDPLAWDCRPDQPTRVRYWRNACFAEHILEFETWGDGSAGKLRLTARGEAEFDAGGGRKLLGDQSLGGPEAAAIVAMLSKRLPHVPSLSDTWQTPRYQSVIEACISGHSYLLARDFQSDEQFERLAQNLVGLAGVRLARKSPGHCM